ncbi:MAG TPA: carbon-nitrogen hydrolase family protein, partial [Propionibacteriaceae bacterium]
DPVLDSPHERDRAGQPLMRIALVQIVADPDPAVNLEQVAAWTERAAAEQAQLVVFPEAMMRCFGRNLVEVAEPTDGPWAQRVREIAATHGVTIVVGMFTPADPGRVYNTLLVTGPDVEAAYDKIHLFDAFGFRESTTVAPGDKPVVVDVGGLKVGFATCYDVRFPGLFTALADDGADLICLCASWGAGPGKLEHWQLLTRARALDSTTFLAACGQADPATIGIMATGKAPTGIGHSAVISPRGEIVAQLEAEPGVLLVDLDPGVLAAVRTAIPVLANRRF